jgi:hypothetical protein
VRLTSPRPQLNIIRAIFGVDSFQGTSFHVREALLPDAATRTSIA